MYKVLKTLLMNKLFGLEVEMIILTWCVLFNANFMAFYAFKKLHKRAFYRLNTKSDVCTGDVLQPFLRH